jgi:hypothetical protein
MTAEVRRQPTFSLSFLTSSSPVDTIPSSAFRGVVFISTPMRDVRQGPLVYLESINRMISMPSPLALEDI